MNAVNLIGRLVRDPEIKYTSGNEPIAVAKYTLAVNRLIHSKDGVSCDFLNCVVFKKSAEFAEKYFKKGMLIGVTGRININSWNNKDGKKIYSTSIVVDNQYFAESKNKNDKADNLEDEYAGFEIVDDIEDDELPF